MYPYRWQQSPDFHIHDVVLIELSETFIEVVFKYRCIGYQSICHQKSLLKSLPHYILAGIGTVWVLGEKREVSNETVEANEKEV